MMRIHDELLKESNNKYIVFIGTRDCWDEFAYYADSTGMDWCIIDDTRIDFYDVKLKEYHESRWNNKKPDLVITEFIIHKLPKQIKNKLSSKYKVITL